MKTTHRYEIWPATLKPDQLWEAVQSFANERGMLPDGPGYFKLQTSAFEETFTTSLEEFLKIIKPVPFFELISTQQLFGKESQKHVKIGVDIAGRKISISAESNDVDIVSAIQTHLSSNFGLRKRELPLPNPSRATYPQPTIFLGRHFDSHASKTVEALRRFLLLLGFRVQEGEAYTSRSIPEKVKERVEQQSIYVALITQATGHDWLTAEAAYALGKDKHIILIVENGVDFNPTILGRDLEQIRFPVDLIEKSFVKLLEEFRDIGVRL